MICWKEEKQRKDKKKIKVKVNKKKKTRIDSSICYGCNSADDPTELYEDSDKDAVNWIQCKHCTRCDGTMMFVWNIVQAKKCAFFVLKTMNK